jgi:hypothetical protein
MHQGHLPHYSKSCSWRSCRLSNVAASESTVTGNTNHSTINKQHIKHFLSAKQVVLTWSTHRYVHFSSRIAQIGVTGQKILRFQSYKDQSYFRVKNKLKGRNRNTMKLWGPLANFTGFNWKSNCFCIVNLMSRAHGLVDSAAARFTIDGQWCEENRSPEIRL